MAQPHVLIFEADTPFARELEAELRQRRCTVWRFDDAERGLAHARAQRPDVVVLSIELPRMNGFAICNKLKKDDGLKAVPVIVLSSESTEETFEMHKKLRTHADAYAHTPVTLADLLQVIDRFLSPRR